MIIKRVGLLWIIIVIMMACRVVQPNVPISSETQSYLATETAAYWETQGITPTIDIFSLTATRVIIEATATADGRLTYEAWATQGTPTPSRTPNQIARDATFVHRTILGEATHSSLATETAVYWETQGVTPTPNSFMLTATEFMIEATQTAENAFANGCEQVETDHLLQLREIDFTVEPIRILSHDRTNRGQFFDCPNPSDIPPSQIDFKVDVIFPANDHDNLNAYIAEAITLLPDYPFSETTFGTDNLELYVKPNWFGSPTWYSMQFAYSDMLSALESDFEDEALINALGGLQRTLP